MAMLNNQMVYIIMMAVIGIMRTVQSYVPKNQPLVHAINGNKIPAQPEQMYKFFQHYWGSCQRSSTAVQQLIGCRI